MGHAKWPDNGLERVEACPVCNEKSRTLLYDGLTDRVFFCAPGRWTLYACNYCHSAYLDPRPTPETIGIAYNTYFTHEEKGEVVPKSRFGLLKRGLRNGYLNARYKTNLRPSMSIGRFITPLLPQKRTLNELIRNLPTHITKGKLVDIG
jgi:hypothetical protein